MRYFIICLLTILISACASRDTQVTVPVETDFSILRSFVLQPSSKNQDVSAKADALYQAFEQHLQQKGYTKANLDNADFSVRYFHYVDSEQNDQRVSVGLGTGAFGRRGGVTVGGVFDLPLGAQVTDYQNIQVDIVVDGQLVWQANSGVRLDPNDQVSMQSAPNELVEKVMQSFPSSSSPQNSQKSASQIKSENE